MDCVQERLTKIRISFERTRVVKLRAIATAPRERHACLREIFEHAATEIAITNLDRVFVKCNPAFCQLVVYSEDELRSIHFLKLVHPDDQGCINSVNQVTETMFGDSSSELVGQNVRMLMPQPFKREHEGYIQRFLAVGEPHILGRGRVCLRKDGSTSPADLAVNQVDQLGHFTRILRDTSSGKEMQKDYDLYWLNSRTRSICLCKTIEYAWT